jgi:hypothetical protein
MVVDAVDAGTCKEVQSDCKGDGKQENADEKGLDKRLVVEIVIAAK